MANVKITDLTAYTNPVSTDVLPIVDVGADVTKKISIADLLENAGSGTAAAPGIAFDGDSNTGIYRPGADQVAISTNGTGRLFVDASGNVGIGTAPGAQLDILSSGFSNLRVRSSATNSATINLTNSARNYSFNTNSGDFYIRDESAVAERLRITSAGLVGIGASSPGNSLEVVGDYLSGAEGHGTLNITSNNTGNGGQDARPSIGFSAPFGPANERILYGLIEGRKENAALGISAGFLAFSTSPLSSAGPVERMRINSLGRVGIGTTTPGVALDVNGDARADGLYGYGDSNTGIDFPGSDVIVFKEGGAEAARIDSSGRFLVGTSTSADLGSSMQTAQTSGTGAFEAFQFSNSAAYPYITFAKSRGASVGTNAIVQNGDPLGEIVFRGANGTGYNTAASITASVDAVPGASNDMPGRLVFSTTADGASSPTERMRISATGQLSTSFASGSNGITSRSTDGAGTTYFLYLGMHSGASNVSGGINVFYVYTNGDVANTNDVYGAISDVKLKENIVDAGSQWDDFKAVRFRKYNFKEETGHETFTQLGVIAQELELISPGLVTETPDLDEEGNDLGTTTKSVKYSILTKKALVALQEAMERIEVLEAKVNALEGN